MRKANRKGQRLLAAALCVGMLAGMVPAQAFADDTQPTAVVEQAVTEETPPAADETTDTDTDTTGDENQNTDPEQGSEDNTQPTEEKNDENTGDSSDEQTPAETPKTETETPAAPDTQEADQTQTVTHIATTVGQLPTGIEWATDVTADTFAEPYATVKAKAANGTEYTVEVIPADTVYFIDSVAASGDKGQMDKVTTTPAYAAAKALLGDKLLNKTSDQFYKDGTTWGLVDSDAQTKGDYDKNIADKEQTGVYAKHNDIGETLSYSLTLPAGKYKLTSYHREWWSGPRNFTTSVTNEVGAKLAEDGSITVSSTSVNAKNTVEFSVAETTVVTYTLTATTTQAPVISWLAVERTGEAETTDPDTPDTPDADNENFGKALEDIDYVTTRTGASLVDSLTQGKQASVTSGWISGGNSAVDGGAAIKEADSFFKRHSFTLYTDFKFNDENDNTSAVLVGPAADANFRIIPRKTNGKAVLKVNNGTEYVLSKELKAGEWNALALVYSENDTEGTVAVYLNGEEVLPATGVGFKLSQKTGIVGAFGATFGTGFMRTGLYDNIVVTGTADADAAKAETATRKETFADIVEVDGVVSVTGAEVETAKTKTNGWTYKGLGMLNGNSTSNLLLDYKAENPTAYWAMMNYLFGGDYPLFTNIKMEMGNDGNNSTGAEACTMRYEDEEADASRSPGFAMAADAKAINSDVKVSILRWRSPNWVNAYSGQDKYAAIYKWYKETIFDAYEKYGYVVDYINPDTNETENPDGEIIKYFANALKNEKDFPSYFTEEAKQAYNNIKIVASDENKSLNIVPLMRRDEGVYNAVDAIGFHYRTNATDDYIAMADVDNKEVWYSEGCATFGYSELQENKTIEYGAGTIGGYQSPLALLDSLPNAFIGSRRTMYMFQPAIGSFYEGIQYGHKELLSARDPWSGYIHYDPVLYMLSHITKFAKTGWENDTNSNGIWRVLPGATFASFGASSDEHATAGINGSASYMTLAAPDKKDFSTVFINNTSNEKTFAIKLSDMEVAVDALHVWTTETDSYLQPGEDAEIKDGIATITVPAYSVVTATTLDTTPERFPTEQDTNGDGIKGVGDDYVQTETRTVLDTDATGKTSNTDDDYLYADNFEYEEEADNYLTERGNEPRYMLDTHGAWIVEDGQLKQENASSVSQWNGGDPATIVGDWRWMDYGASIDVTLPNADANRYERLTIRAQTGMNWNNSGYTLEINGTGNWKLYRIGTEVKSGSVPKNAKGKYSLRLVGLGDTVYAYINGIRVTSYTDANPMLSGRVKISSNWTQVYADNLEVKRVPGGIPYATAMIDGQDDGVKYEGTWAINNPGGGSADNWYRTISSSSTAGASFTFTINGSGFAIMGGNNGTAVLDVYVDNVLKDADAKTKAAPTRGEAYILSDLEAGKHTIKVVLKSGTLKIDALNTLGARIDKVANPASVDASQGEIEYYITGSDTVPGLAKKATVTKGGKTEEQPIVWNLDQETLDSSIFSNAAIYGVVGSDVDDLGYPLVTSVTIKEVIPYDTVYFIDMVESDPSKITTTETYELYKKALGDKLLNQQYDQRKTDDNDWGLVDTDAGTKGYTGTADKTATGIYGAYNEAGETLTYALTLPAGSYTLTSAHREWWSQNRPMTVVVCDENGEALSDTVSINPASKDAVPTLTFHLAKETTVQYVITATGTQAPVISWLAVQQQPTETKIYPEKGLNRVQENLKDKFASAQDIVTALEQKLNTIVKDGNVTVYDVKLMLKFSNGIWKEADDSLFPEEGVDVAFPLPDGVTVDTFDKFDIAVAHMFATKDKAGEIEQLDVKLDKENAKIVVHVNSLSPFAVTCKAKQQPTPVQPDNGNNNNSNTTNNTNSTTTTTAKDTTAETTTTTTAKESPAKTARVPQTSDTFPIVPIAAAMLLSLNGLIVLILRKREQKHK